MSNYSAKSDLKDTTDFDSSEVTKKTDLGSLKWEIDELDIDKLETTPAD